VFLWDRDSSVTTLSESIDFGLGNIQIIEQVEGEIIGISLRTDVAGGTSKIVIRSYAGGLVQMIVELIASSATSLQLLTGQKFNANRSYFLAGIEINGEMQQGIWCIGKNSVGRWIVWLDKLPNNDTGITASGSLEGFFILGDFLFAAYNDSGYVLTQTSTITTAYAGSSIIETIIYDSGDASLEKDLRGVSVTYSPLPEDGQVVLKYKKDAETAWTTIFTDTTDDSISHSSVNVESTGVAFGQHKEIQFRIESTGGAQITGFSFQIEITGKRAYD
jgi:hypothetical protein